MSTQERLPSPEIEKAAAILKKGGIVIFPTDTVYGIGCRFDDLGAIGRLYQIKGTPPSQPFPILVTNTDQVKKFAKITTFAKFLIDAYWPGGLTIIFAGRKIGQKQAFRMPDSEVVKSLIDKVGVPIVGTSANFHGQKTPSSFEELDPEITKLANFVIRGKCQKGIESTVVDTTVKPPKILRQGAVPLEL